MWIRLRRLTPQPYTHAFLLIAALPLAVAAQNAPASSAPQPTPQPAPKPCLDAAERRRFDFWIGEWEVKTQAGMRVGSSVIQSVSGGCALLENWTNARGGQGKSLNAYNPAVGQWQQYWIGQDGNPTEYRESSWSGPSIVFRARAAASGSTPASELRLTFTPLDSVTVRQHGETSTDGGATWKTQYDLYYHRKK